MTESYDRPVEVVEPVVVSTTEPPQLEDIEVEVKRLEPETQVGEKVRIEEFTITGDALVSKVKELIHQGNIRRIIIKNDEGRILMELPLTVGVVGGAIATAIFPIVAAVGAIGALVAHLQIVIEKIEE